MWDQVQVDMWQQSRLHSWDSRCCFILLYLQTWLLRCPSNIILVSLLLTLILLVFYLIHIFNFQGVFWFCRHAISRGKRWKLPMPSNNIFVDFIGFVLISGKARNRYFFIGLSEALLSWKICSSAPVQYWGTCTIFSSQNFYL